MPTKQEWLDHIEERKSFEETYEKETNELEKKVKQLPADGEMSVAQSGLETPVKPPPNP